MKKVTKAVLIAIGGLTLVTGVFLLGIFGQSNPSEKEETHVAKKGESHSDEAAEILSETAIENISRIDKNVTVTVLANEKNFKAGGEYYELADPLLREFADKSEYVTLEFKPLE